jgi:hypothetical protein
VVNAAFPPCKKDKERFAHLKTFMRKLSVESNLFAEAEYLVEKAYSGRDLAKFVEESDVETMFKYEWLLFYFNHRENFRVEVMFVYVLLYTFVYRPKTLLV